MTNIKNSLRKQNLSAASIFCQKQVNFYRTTAFWADSFLVFGVPVALHLGMKKLKRISQLILINFLTTVGLLFVSIQSKAAAPECVQLFSQSETFFSSPKAVDFPAVEFSQWMALDHYGQYDYSRHQNILFLSDGGKGGRVLENKKRPSQLVVSSDIGIFKGVSVQADNNNLPFRSNSFDLIVMNRGLCPCHSAVACGGIDTKREPMKKFLLSAIEILDKNNPKSLALFTGYYFPGLFNKTVPDLWISIAQEVQAMYPNLQISLLTATTSAQISHGFVGLAVSANTEIPIREQVRELIPNF